MQKQARQLKIDANSTRFRDMIRLFWMPRLLQKMASPPSTQSLNPTPTLPNLVPQSSPSPPESHTTSEQNPPTNSYYSHKSFSEDCSSSISSNSMNITQLPHMSKFPTGPQDFGNADHTALLKNCYVDESYGLEALNLGSTSTSGFNYPLSDFSMTGNTCVDDDMVDCLWNMDELWQFRKHQGRSI